MEAVLVRKEEQEKRTRDIARFKKVTGGVIEPTPPSQDLTGAEYIEVHISEDGKTLWVNNEYTCILRVCKIKKLFLRDDRSRKE